MREEKSQSSKRAASMHVQGDFKNRQMQKVSRLYVQFGSTPGKTSDLHGPCYLWLMQLTSNQINFDSCAVVIIHLTHSMDEINTVNNVLCAS